jgi:hypothetical protein
VEGSDSLRRRRWGVWDNDKLGGGDGGNCSTQEYFTGPGRFFDFLDVFEFLVAWVYYLSVLRILLAMYKVSNSFILGCAGPKTTPKTNFKFVQHAIKIMILYERFGLYTMYMHLS